MYRLGLFGFLACNDIAADLQRDGFEGNGNFGLTDQQLALEWIQKHIAVFEGDKKNVTIFGESAGGMSVAAQMISRKGPSLFHRAAQLSGSMGSFQAFTPDEHEIFYERILRYFGIPLDAADRLQQLQAISDDQISAATQPVFTAFITIPSLCNDGWFWENKDGYSPFELSAPPSWLKSFMTGETRDEGMIFRDEIWRETPDLIRERLQKRLDAAAVQDVIKLYDFHENVTYAEKNRILEDMAGDVYMRIPNVAIGDACVNLNTPVPSFFYHFDQRCSFSDNIYNGDAFHALDLVYIFLTRYEGVSPEERPVADAMHTAFIEFTHGVSPWEEYKASRKWRVWGPNGKIKMLSEDEDEKARNYSRLRYLQN